LAHPVQSASYVRLLSDPFPFLHNAQHFYFSLFLYVNLFLTRQTTPAFPSLQKAGPPPFPLARSFAKFLMNMQGEGERSVLCYAKVQYLQSTPLFCGGKKISQRVLASEFVPFALQDLRGRYSSTSTSYIKPSGISHGQRT